jgi:hypothetical protein
MNAFYIILAASPVLLLGVVTFLVVIAVGVRKGDRSDLASPARNRIDAITRRMTGLGTRSNVEGGIPSAITQHRCPYGVRASRGDDKD